MRGMVFLILFLFVKYSNSIGFAQFTDFHVGATGVYYKCSDYDLMDLMNGLNSRIEKYKLKFVIGMILDSQTKSNLRYFTKVTGDLVYYGDSESMKKARNALDRLKVPYFPLLGNHEIYGEEDKPNYPTGDRRFNEIFSEKYSISNDVLIISHYTGDIAVDDPTSETKSYFVNFQVEYDGVIILGVDFNSRRFCEYCELHQSDLDVTDVFDFPGGTWEWLNLRLFEIKDRVDDLKKIIITMHHPLKSWQDIPKTQFTDLLVSLNDSMKGKLYMGDISGHIHSVRDYYHKLENDVDFVDHVSAQVQDRDGVQYRIFTVGDDGSFEKVDIGEERIACFVVNSIKVFNYVWLCTFCYCCCICCCLLCCV